MDFGMMMTEGKKGRGDKIQERGERAADREGRRKDRKFCKKDSKSETNDGITRKIGKKMKKANRK